MKIDLRFLHNKYLGKESVNDEDLEFLANKYESANSDFEKNKDKFGFMNLPFQSQDIENAIKKIQIKISSFNEKKQIKNIVLIGIGGSDLGAKALHHAINGLYYNEKIQKNVLKSRLKLFFMGDTTDPSVIKDIFSIIDLEKTIFFIISKSGNTIEQASCFIYAREQLKKIIKSEEVNDHFVFFTDPEKGVLRKLAKNKGYYLISIPENVGGRFSVLSVVGLVRSSLTGIDFRQVLNGARDMHEKLDSKFDHVKYNPAKQYALINLFYLLKQKNIKVIWPYSYYLKDFSLWFRQLWAESLGKKVDKKGHQINAGTTPVAALGPTDQHSQLQLYNEGKNDKLYTFIVADNAEDDISLHSNEDLYEDYNFFKGWNFQDILIKEFETTRYALIKNKRPTISIHIPTLDEYNLGKLFYFFEYSVVYFGYLLNINPFDQPGVELSKQAMYGVLGKKGYEKQKKAFESFQNL